MTRTTAALGMLMVLAACASARGPAEADRSAAAVQEAAGAALDQDQADRQAAEEAERYRPDARSIE
ncbi:MAG TPA: hypothetical protein VF689_05790, partial [Allosphingosinicella sp.]